MRSALVIGGSTGIGAETVRLLADMCDLIVFTYAEDSEPARRLAQEVPHAEYRQFALEGDPEELVEMIRRGTFRYLVFGAFPRLAPARFLEIDRGALERMLQPALRYFAVAQSFAARLSELGETGSAVIVLSSVVQGAVPSRQADYVIGKHALLGLMKAMAAELIQYGVRVNAVSPGMTRTDYIAFLSARHIELIGAGTQLGRLAEPGEVAGVIRFLLSDESSYVHGQNVLITGGP